jgi:hypothetical protein
MRLGPSVKRVLLAVLFLGISGLIFPAVPTRAVSSTSVGSCASYFSSPYPGPDQVCWVVTVNENVLNLNASGTTAPSSGAWASSEWLTVENPTNQYYVASLDLQLCNLQNSTDCDFEGGTYFNSTSLAPGATQTFSYTSSVIGNQTVALGTLLVSVDQVPTLNSELNAAEALLQNVTAQVGPLRFQVKALTQQLNSVKATLNATLSSLADAETQLNSTQAELNSYVSVYLPLGVAIPSVVAVVLAVLLLWKGRRS